MLCKWKKDDLQNDITWIVEKDWSKITPMLWAWDEQDIISPIQQWKIRKDELSYTNALELSVS